MASLLYFSTKLLRKPKPEATKAKAEGLGVCGWVIPLLTRESEFWQVWLQSQAAPDGAKVPGGQASGHTKPPLYPEGIWAQCPLLDSFSSRVIRGRF